MMSVGHRNMRAGLLSILCRDSNTAVCPPGVGAAGRANWRSLVGPSPCGGAQQVLRVMQCVAVWPVQRTASPRVRANDCMGPICILRVM